MLLVQYAEWKVVPRSGTMQNTEGETGLGAELNVARIWVKM